jgi:hypothetical protein
MSTAFDERFRVLAGQAPIHDFVRFVRTRANGGQQMDELALTREWQRANVHLRELESAEKNFADMGPLEPLPQRLAAVAAEALQDTATQKSMSFLPYRWAMVELDRLIVWQKYVNLDFTDGLRQSLPSRPTIDELLRVTIGAKREAPAVHVTTLGSNSFAFLSPSTDIRVLGAVPLDPANISGYESYGRAAAVLAVYIGFSVNVMYGVRMENRVMLVNGTHRAYALRAHGVTHAPCLISEVSNPDDLDLVGLPEQKESSRSYFARRRPPLLKDYFDERLYKEVLAARYNHIIQLDLQFERTRTPACP